jgi:predicted heme/steroid binding protein
MDSSLTLPTYTRSELALRNGQDRSEIWIAWEGKIFDVTGSRLWKNGKHYEHWAGQDLTEELADSPHGRRVFEGREPIGVLMLV